MLIEILRDVQRPTSPLHPEEIDVKNERHGGGLNSAMANSCMENTDDLLKMLRCAEKEV